MKVAIHQPEHFPYLGFFQKMKEADMFVILDTVKYRKNYFLNRNKFLNTNGIDEWFTIPINKTEYNKLILDVKLPQCDWKNKIITKLKQNLNFLDDEVYEGALLVDVNINTIKWCMSKLKIDIPIIKASTLDISLDENETKTSKLLKIVKCVDASHYVSGQSGKDYLDVSKFTEQGIDISFFQPTVSNYYSTLYNIMKL